MSYTVEEANELIKGKHSQKFRGSAIFFGLVAAKQIQEMNSNLEINEIIDTFRKNFFLPIKETGVIQRVTPSLRKDFDEMFRFGWSEWMDGRGREHVQDT